MRSNVAYRGYSIKVHPFSGEVWIEKQGFAIVAPAQRTIEEAKQIIDTLSEVQHA